MVLLSKSKVIIFATLAVLIVLLPKCKQADKSNVNTTENTVCVKTKSLNPNGDSELALLMRQMYDSLNSMNRLIKNGGVPSKFPESFLKIHTAKPTTSNTKLESFDAFADDYIATLRLLYNSPKADLNKNYNLLVQKCANCHEASCPGPLKKIYKLKLDI